MTKMNIVLALLAASGCGGSGLGDATRADIQAQMQKTQAPIQACYEGALKSNRKLRGMIVVDLVAEPQTGQFKNIMISHDELQNPSVRDCVVAEVAKQKLATPTSSQISISYPINFAPNN